MRSGAKFIVKIMIRFFKASDRDFYVNLSEQFYSSDACDHSVPLNNFALTFDECVNNSPYARGVIVEYNGKSVGYGLYSITFSAEAGGKVVWLEELFILPEYRNKGLGKEFFEFVYAENRDAKRFRLEATPINNNAIRLYERLGYKVLPYVQMIKDIE